MHCFIITYLLKCLCVCVYLHVCEQYVQCCPLSPAFFHFNYNLHYIIGVLLELFTKLPLIDALWIVLLAQLKHGLPLLLEHWLTAGQDENQHLRGHPFIFKERWSAHSGLGRSALPKWRSSSISGFCSWVGQKWSRWYTGRSGQRPQWCECSTSLCWWRERQTIMSCGKWPE